jgi:hypothetical protein
MQEKKPALPSTDLIYRYKDSNIKSYTQLIPEKILENLNDIAELLRPEIISFNIDYMIEVISIVSCHIPKKKDPSEIEITGDNAGPLDMNLVRRLVPSGDRYLLKLVGIGIVKRSGNYNTGKCYKYCFALEYQSRYLKIPLNNMKLIKRIEKEWDERKKKR